MKLSFRLSNLHSYYHHQQSIWDIGCDHGNLGLSFVGRPAVVEINLVDPSSAVIEQLKEKVKDAYITRKDLKINLLHQKGQSLTLSPYSKLIFIAGMGGEEIREIVKHLSTQLNEHDRVVVSPHRKVFELRSYLETSDFGLFDEKFIKDDGQFYPVICLSKERTLPKVSLFGQKMWEDLVGQEYRLQQIQNYSPHKDQLSQDYLAYLKGLSL